MLKPIVVFISIFVLLSCDRQVGQPTTEPFPLVEATIGDVQSALLSGKTTCKAIVSGYLKRVEAYDIQRGINAITVINPRAIDIAETIDAEIKMGNAMPELFCVPVLLKDNFDTHDMITTGGSIALKNSIPPDDAFMVKRLREAGAIIIAKTNMAEWAFSPRQTISSSFGGRTANAYDTDYVPAGSSGGSASAVAASFGLAGMGTDTGNSIRGPSSHLALFGIRSTIGLTSRDGIIPLAYGRDIAGPMARTVEDGVRIFNVVAGYDPADKITVPNKREHDYRLFLRKGQLQGKRLGLLRQLYEWDTADPEILAIFDNAIKELEAQGAIIIDPFTIPDLEDHMNNDANYCQSFRYDMWRYLKSLGGKAPITDVLEVLETGSHTKETERALRGDLKYPINKPTEKHDEPCYSWPNNPSRQAYLKAVVDTMDAAQVDAIIYPSWSNPPAKIDRAREDYLGDNSQFVAPATGLPALVVPMGYWQDKLPVGIQFLGRPYSEGLLIELAYSYEQATKHRKPPEGFPELHTN